MIDYNLAKFWNEYRVMTECCCESNTQLHEQADSGLITKIMKVLAAKGYCFGETFIEIHNNQLYFVSRYEKYPTEEQIQRKHNADVKALTEKINELLPIFSILSAYHAVQSDMVENHS